MNRLKEIREDRDLKQKELSEILNVSQVTYSYYEIGKRQIPIESLKRLARFYDVSVDYLLYMTDERKPYPKSKIISKEK